MSEPLTRNQGWDCDENEKLEQSEENLREYLGTEWWDETIRAYKPVFDAADAELLAQGTFGKIYRHELNGMSFAIKVISIGSMDTVARVSSLTEVWVMRQRCFGCLRLFGYCLSSTRSKLHDTLTLWLELYDRSLYDEIAVRKASNSPFKFEDICQIGISIAQGIDAMHSKGIIHHDLKSKNILSRSMVQTNEDEDGSGDKYHVALCDFGLSEISPSHDILNIAYHSANTPRAGSIRWKAPELASPETWSSTSYSDLDRQKCDIWSFGAVLLELITLGLPYPLIEYPWEVKDAWKRRENPLNGVEILWPRNECAGSSFQSLLESCFKFDPSLRPSAKNVISTLSFI